MFIATLGGFLLGQLTLPGFILLLMAVFPSEQVRSLSNRMRVIHSVEMEDGPLISPLLNGNKSLGEELLRQSRFLRNLLRMDPLNCLPQVMCELSSAQEPDSGTNTINDFKYLVKEILSEEDGPPKKSSNANTSRKNLKAIDPKSTSSSEDSSQAAPSPSSEKTLHNFAELMQLEEEDEMEDTALAHLINENPDDLHFAFKDIKKKDTVKYMIANGEFDSYINKDPMGYPFDFQESYRMNYKRNLKLLEKSLADNERRGIFRGARAVEMEFLARKKRQLETELDAISRTRIAAEVGQRTRNSRQCRALFENCPLPAPNKGIRKVVNNLRNAVVGGKSRSDGDEESRRSTDKLVSYGDLETILYKMGGSSRQGQGGSDIKVILNIGQDSIRNKNPENSKAFMPVTVELPTDQPVVVNTEGSKKPVSHLQRNSPLQFLPSQLTKPKKVLNYQLAESKKPINSLKPTFLNDYTSQFEKISEVLATVSPKNDLAVGKKGPKNELESVQKQLEDLISVVTRKDVKKRLKSPKVTSDSESESDESPESSEEKPKPRKPLERKEGKKKAVKKVRTKLNKNVKGTGHNETGVTPVVVKAQYTPAVVEGHYNKRGVVVKGQYKRGVTQMTEAPRRTSFLGNIYSVFFREREVGPLPQNSDEYTPSAQRHLLRARKVPFANYYNDYNNGGNFYSSSNSQGLPLIPRTPYYIQSSPPLWRGQWDK